MNRQSDASQQRSIKVVCKNGHTLAKLPKGDTFKGDGVVEIKCRRCRHYVYVLIDVKGRIKIKNGFTKL